MARPPKITPTLTADIAARLRRGESRDLIAPAVGVSKSTVDRVARMLQKSAQALAKPKPQPAPVDPGTEPVSDAADAGEIGHVIAEVKAAADKAKAEGNLTAYASLMARLVALLEHQRKVTPAPPPDHNDNPDFAAAKERVRKEMHRLIDHNLITRVIE